MRRLVLALGVVAALSACAGDGATSEPTTPPVPDATTAITNGWGKLAAGSREQLCALAHLDPEMFWGMWQATMGTKFPDLDRPTVEAFMDERC